MGLPCINSIAADEYAHQQGLEAERESWLEAKADEIEKALMAGQTWKDGKLSWSLDDATSCPSVYEQADRIDLMYFKGELTAEAAMKRRAKLIEDKVREIAFDIADRELEREADDDWSW